MSFLPLISCQSENAETYPNGLIKIFNYWKARRLKYTKRLHLVNQHKRIIVVESRSTQLI